MEPNRVHQRKSQVTRIKVLLACALCLVAGGAATFAGILAAVGPEGLALLQAERLIQKKFVGEYDETAVHQATLEAMVTSLGDRWSYYLTPEEYERTKENRTNTYVGIGITVDREARENGLLILSVAEGSPAQEAALLVGEIIRTVDGTAVTPETMDACINNIKGAEGTTVQLEVEGLDGVRRTMDIQRRTIQEISAQWEMLDSGAGLITIQNFFAGTAGLVAQGVEELSAQGASALILDVRNNPGGFVAELTQALDVLLPEGDIFISCSTDGEETVYTSDADCVDLPLAVLVNGESYSAAEFFAAQLRESAGAVVVGTRTSGKGYSQILFELADGSGIGLSTARYYTGSGVSLIGTGLEPEPSVELSQEAKAKLYLGQLPHEEDLQLQASLRALGLL